MRNNEEPIITTEYAEELYDAVIEAKDQGRVDRSYCTGFAAAIGWLAGDMYGGESLEDYVKGTANIGRRIDMVEGIIDKALREAFKSSRKGE